MSIPERYSIGQVAPAAQAHRVGSGFITLFTMAQVGAFVSFVPLLQLLVPLQAMAMDPAHGALVLSNVALWGAVAASIANIVFGALSDRTHTTRGRRRPWVFGGLAASLCTYAMIWRAGTPGALLFGVVAFQIAFNAMFAPLGAVLADDVPDGQRGVVSALLGLGYPLGNLIGAVTVGVLVTDPAARFVALGVLVTVAIAPFAWRLGASAAPPGHTPLVQHAALPAGPGQRRDFALALAGRFLVVTAFNLMQGYMLVYLQRLADRTNIISGRPEAALAQLAAIATACNISCALVGGWLSDRVGRRKPFVFAGGACMAGGIACIALAHSWAGLQSATVLYGGGAGLYYAVDMALIVQVLPSLQSAGRNLGIVNLSNTVPQVIAPLLALHMLGGGVPDYFTMFLFGALAALLGAICVLGIKTAR
jgi:MFS family permease